MAPDRDNVSCASAGDEAVNRQVSPDLMRESVGCTIWHVLGCGGAMHTDVKEESSDSGDDSMHSPSISKAPAVAA